MADIGVTSLDWLYKQQRKAQISLAHAEERQKGCPACREIEDLKRKLAVLDWLIGAAIRAL